MNFAPIPEILEDIRQGRMVVIVDGEDRENEGDLIMAAELVKPSDINFMVTHGRGLVCLPLTRTRAADLGLAPMVQANTAQFQTNFTVSIEAAEGVTTGISAHDRAHTIRTAVKPNARPADLHQPGHIFPLIAQPGGVLTRAGHTEAGVDLAMLAGLEPAGVLVEILNPDGSMARRPELEVWTSATSTPNSARSSWSPTATASPTTCISPWSVAPRRPIPRPWCGCRWKTRWPTCCTGAAMISAWPPPMPCARLPPKGQA